MALFGKLFSKEACISCGKEVGSLSRKRLADGVICKECAKQLSPWFDDFKGSSASDISEQLAQRQLNRARLSELTFTKAYGEGCAILIDERAGVFCVIDGSVPGKVSRGSDLLDYNPDIIPLASVTGVDIDTSTVGHEIKHTVDGEQVSYSPRRYEYPCNVRVSIAIDHPYVHRMTVNLNRGTITIKTEGERLRNVDVRQSRSAGQATADWLLGRSTDVQGSSEAWADNSLEARLRRPLDRMLANPSDDFPDYAYGFRCSRENWSRIKEYGRFVEMAEEVRAVLTAAA